MLKVFKKILGEMFKMKNEWFIEIFISVWINFF